MPKKSNLQSNNIQLLLRPLLFSKNEAFCPLLFLKMKILFAETRSMNGSGSIPQPSLEKRRLEMLPENIIIIRLT